MHNWPLWTVLAALHVAMRNWLLWTVLAARGTVQS